MTVMITGACMAACGFAGGLHLLFTIDTGRGWRWLRALSTLAMYLLIPGLIVFLIGLGMWLAHPHAIHY